MTACTWWMHNPTEWLARRMALYLADLYNIFKRQLHGYQTGCIYAPVAINISRTTHSNTRNLWAFVLNERFPCAGKERTKYSGYSSIRDISFYFICPWITVLKIVPDTRESVPEYIVSNQDIPLLHPLLHAMKSILYNHCYHSRKVLFAHKLWQYTERISTNCWK